MKTPKLHSQVVIAIASIIIILSDKIRACCACILRKGDYKRFSLKRFISVFEDCDKYIYYAFEDFYKYIMYYT